VIYDEMMAWGERRGGRVGAGFEFGGWRRGGVGLAPNKRMHSTRLSLL
jgi:hypothetical protein